MRLVELFTSCCRDLNRSLNSRLSPWATCTFSGRPSTLKSSASTLASALFIGDGASGGNGTYDLSGGALIVQNTLGTGEIVNDDTLNYSGGSLTADVITNNAAFNLSGAGTRTVNGDVTNYGTVKVTGTTVDWQGTYTEFGTYNSDPSDNYFADLIVGGTGYLLGGAGDNFYVSGDFTNNSTQNTLWDTVNAYLGFTGTGAHTMSITGSTQTGDFSFGTMEVFGGGTLNFTGASLYVNNLVLGAGSTVNLSGVNIYYTSLTDYGGTYSGGQLLQVADASEVPEPGTILLLATGFAGLVGLRRRLRA
jgi:hypothetical protein